MTDQVEIYGFETSNNMKVRAALGYKGIPFTFHSIDPADRTEVVRLSGQHLTPVMVHGDRVLFDSAAILRYLDANFPESPRLFGDSHAGQWLIEDWEGFGRSVLAGPMMEIVHTRVTGGTVDEAMTTRAHAAFALALETLEKRLQDREWLAGDELTAADITCAAVVHRIRISGVLPMPEEMPRIEHWVARVMVHDQGPTPHS